MRKVKVPITNFSFGEVSDSTLMRTDTPVYQASGQTVENLFILAEGGLKRRPALKELFRLPDTSSSVGPTYDPSKRMQLRVFPFKYSHNEEYMVMLWEGGSYVLRLNEDGFGTPAINFQGQPWIDADYLHEYTFAQYGDFMIICHPLIPPKVLQRRTTGLTSFTFYNFSFDERNDGSKTFQPYSIFHRADVTLSASGTTGSVTLTTSDDYFVSDHVGVILKYFDTEIEITGYIDARNVTGTVNGTLKQRLSVLNPLRSRDSSNIIEVTHLRHGFSGGESITLENASGFDGISAAQLNGARTVGTIIDENTYTITASHTATSSEDGGGYVEIITGAATTEWSEQSFSSVRGYPAAVAFHENRLVFAGTIAEPGTLWFSRSSRFFNFDVGDAEDDASINLVAASSTVHEIRYLVSSRDLHVFAASAELYVPRYLNQPLTPTNAQLKVQTAFGSEFVHPKVLDGATLFVQRGGRTVREYAFTDSEDAYVSTAVSTIASHLVNDPLSMTVCHGAFGGADSYAAMPTSDGKMALFTSNRAERRAGWCKFSSSEIAFVDAASIGDRMFAIVRYTETDHFAICEFASDRYLDCSRLLTGTGSTTITVPYYGPSRIGHTEITDLKVFQNGSTLDVTVTCTQSSTNSAFVYTFSEPVSGGLEVGLPFTVTYKTNPFDLLLGDGPQTGEIRGVCTASLDWVNTTKVSVNSRDVSEASAFTGKKEIRLLGYDRDPKVTVSQPDTGDFQINGLIAEVVV